jgi:hypothetical protein
VTAPSSRRRGRAVLVVVGLGLLAVVVAGVVVNIGSAPAPFSAAPARTLTEREWALIAKDPDAHAGERVVVHGRVTQFDPNTGDASFRADVSGVAEPAPLSGTNTLLTGRARDLAPVVEGDRFTAEVTVRGATS